MPKASRTPVTGPERQRQAIEKAPGFEIGALISGSGSFFNLLLFQVRRGDFNALGVLLVLLPFLPFLFRPLESQSNIGVQPSPHRDSGYTRPGVSLI